MGGDTLSLKSKISCNLGTSHGRGILIEGISPDGVLSVVLVFKLLYSPSSLFFV